MASDLSPHRQSQTREPLDCGAARVRSEAGDRIREPARGRRATLTHVVALACAAVMSHGVARAVPPPAVKLVATIPLKTVEEGDFDQMVADLSTSRLFVSVEDSAAMEVFDLRTGELLHTGGNVASPHKPILDGPGGDLFVADGDDGSVKVLDQELHPVARIPIGDKPDTGVYDPAQRLFYVGSRAGHSEAMSVINVISTRTRKVLRRIPIAGSTLKGMVLDESRGVILAGLRDKNAVCVVDLGSGKVTYWRTPGLHQNVPMALDKLEHVLFVGSRRPGALSVLDDRDGHMLQTLPSTNVSDSMFYDRTSRRLYVTGDDGLSNYDVDAKGNVAFLGTDATVVGKSSLLVPELHRLYVARPKTSQHVAALEIYDTASSR